MEEITRRENQLDMRVRNDVVDEFGPILSKIGWDVNKRLEVCRCEAVLDALVHHLGSDYQLGIVFGAR